MADACALWTRDALLRDGGKTRQPGRLAGQAVIIAAGKLERCLELLLIISRGRFMAGASVSARCMFKRWERPASTEETPVVIKPDMEKYVRVLARSPAVDGKNSTPLVQLISIDEGVLDPCRQHEKLHTRDTPPAHWRRFAARVKQNRLKVCLWAVLLQVSRQGRLRSRQAAGFFV